MFILRIDLQTGDIIYSLQLPAGLMELSIVGDKAYGCYGYHYMEVDIEKGKLLNFVRIKQCKLIYNYVNFNAIAIRLAPQLDKKKTMKELREMKGVLQVAEDCVLHLDEHRLD